MGIPCPPLLARMPLVDKEETKILQLPSWLQIPLESQVLSGAHGSYTETILVATVVFPAESVAEYKMTILEEVTVLVKFDGGRPETITASLLLLESQALAP